MKRLHLCLGHMRKHRKLLNSEIINISVYEIECRKSSSLVLNAKNPIIREIFDSMSST